MDPLCNPFSPGAGTRPPELAGRNDILQQAMMTLARVKRGRAEKSMLMVGLRGTGKTVLLSEINGLAEKEGYHSIKIEVHEKQPLPELLIPELRRILFALEREEKIDTKVKIKKAFRVLKSFISSVKLNVKIQEIDLGIGIEPERGTADSGSLDSDLPHLFIALGEAAQACKTAVAIIIDELQYATDMELSALIVSFRRIAQESLPVVLIGAGLPQLVGKAGRAKSYAERLFDYPELGPLKKEDAESALQEPVKNEGIFFTQAALDEIIRVTKGYPYFLQEWGYHAWNLADKSPIDVDIARRATTESIKRLDKSFFRVRFDRLTPREKTYLRALAELGTVPQRSGDIADGLGVGVQNAAPLRNNLIKKGMIYSPQHGDTAFTVPLFGEFMKRIMPDFPAQAKKRKLLE